jgi:hypothetical protein
MHIVHRRRLEGRDPNAKKNMVRLGTSSHYGGVSLNRNLFDGPAGHLHCVINIDTSTLVRPLAADV